jgi:hypothetical protein
LEYNRYARPKRGKSPNQGVGLLRIERIFPKIGRNAVDIFIRKFGGRIHSGHRTTEYNMLPE